MKSDKIKCENMLRIHDLKLLDKLQEIYQKSRYRSINEFLNACLKQFAERESKEDEILEGIEEIKDAVNAIYERVKKRQITLFLFVSITSQVINTTQSRKIKFASVNF